MRCLFLLWTFPTFKLAFDLDLLIYLHQFGQCDYSARKRFKNETEEKADWLSALTLMGALLYCFACLFDLAMLLEPE